MGAGVFRRPIPVGQVTVMCGGADDMTEDQTRMEQVTPTERQQRAAQHLLGQWLAVERKAGILDNVTIMTAVTNLVANLLCQYDDPPVA